MGRFLVQQDPHSFAGLHSAPHHCHELWTYELLVFPVLWSAGLGAAQGGGAAGGRRRRLDVHRPVGVHVLCVIQLFEGFDGAADVTVTWEKGEQDYL